MYIHTRVSSTITPGASRSEKATGHTFSWYAYTLDKLRFPDSKRPRRNDNEIGPRVRIETVRDNDLSAT